MWQAQPNAGHRALVELEAQGRAASRCSPRTSTGSTSPPAAIPSLVVQVHGTAHEVMCLSCDERAPMQRALDRVRAGEVDPPCRTCGGILKAAVISFGQNLVVADLERAFDAAASCDLLHRRRHVARRLPHRRGRAHRACAPAPRS